MLLKNLKEAAEISSFTLSHYKNNYKKIKINKSELVEINKNFKKLDDSVSEMFYEIDKINRYQSYRYGN